MDNSTKNQFGIRLRMLRKLRKESQQDIARIIDMSQAAVGTYERGVAYPSLDQLITLADYFDVSIDYLVGRTEIMDRMDRLYKSTSREIVLMEGFYSLSDEAKTKLEEMLDMLKVYYGKRMDSGA